MTVASGPGTGTGSTLRASCEGATPLTGRLEPWAVEIMADPALLGGLLESHGSPVNVIDPRPLARNAAELSAAAERHGVRMRIFFARKASKALCMVDEALANGLGIDVASERELEQTLARGAGGGDVILTAAVKPRALMELSCEAGVTVAIDNLDELDLARAVARASGQQLSVALRLAPAVAANRAEGTRFGFTTGEAIEVARACPPESVLAIRGVHFHLDGYDASARSEAIPEALEVVDSARLRGHRVGFLDIGGGIPMSYLEDEGQWDRFWREHRRGLLDEAPQLTFGGEGLGLIAHEGAIIGSPAVYPYFQRLTRGAWLDEVLGAAAPRGGTVAGALRSSGVELRCEPGRSLADGCGLTAARVEFRKTRPDGTHLVGLAMNRTQCRSTSADFLVDPLLLRARSAGGGAAAGSPTEGYLVGAYCIERELLTWRRLRFPRGVAVGDIVVFPNTAGYLMHILESASHQIPLARNLVVRPGSDPELDPIDQSTSG